MSSVIRKTRVTYSNNKMTACAGDQKALFSVLWIHCCRHRCSSIGALPSGDSNAQIASRLSDFVSESDNIWNSMPTDHAEVSDIVPLISSLL